MTEPHVSCEPAQSKCTRRCHKSHLVRKFTSKRLQAKTAPHVLCEPAKSKCTWTSHKKSFYAEVNMKLTGKRPQTKRKPNSRGRLCASLRSRNAHGHLARAILVLVCAEIYNLRGRRPRLRPTFRGSLRSRNAHRDVTRAILCGSLQVRGRRPRPRPKFCVSLQIRNAHGHLTKGHFTRKLT